MDTTADMQFTDPKPELCLQPKDTFQFITQWFSP